VIFILWLIFPEVKIFFRGFFSLFLWAASILLHPLLLMPFIILNLALKSFKDCLFEA